MATATQVDLSKTSHDLLVNYIKACMESYHATFNVRERLEDADRTYMREADFSPERWKGEMAKRRGDITKFQNITIPIALPQVESAVTFQSEMFLSGFPIFGTVSDPLNQDAAVAMDTIIGDQQIRGGWVLEFQQVFRDAFKYNIAGVCADWARERTFAVAPVQTTTQTELTQLIWEGNTIRRLDMYNTFFDSSVRPDELAAEGEFAGTISLWSGMRLKRWMLNTLGTINSEEAMRSGMTYGFTGKASALSYYFPQLNPAALLDPDSLASTSWNAWWNGTEDREDILRHIYRTKYQVVQLYARICPADFKIRGVPAPTVPQIWKFVLVNNSTIVLAERLTNAHDMLPIVIAQAITDGLGYQTKSLLKNVEPMQEITTALANSSIQSRRRAISDRGLYDPSRISAREINNDIPNAKIPVKPGAFGGDLSSAYYPIPFNDDQFSTNTQEMATYLAMADNITGMNQARQGQFTKGNRTRAEFSSIMAFGSGRDRTTSQSLECSLFQPIKEILKANILQYQAGVRLFNPERQEVVEVDPLKLRKAMLVFKLSDGLLPSERLMDSESLTIAMQTMQAVPQIAEGYNIVPMFSYIMKMRGAKLRPFEKRPEQLAYEQAMAQWQQVMMQAAQQVSEALKGLGANVDMEQAQAMIQEITKQLPPQPKPEEFGYDPKKAVQGEDARSVFAQVQLEGSSPAGESA